MEILSISAETPFWHFPAPRARTCGYKRKIAVRNLPQLFFVYGGTNQTIAFVFRQTAINVFGDIFADVAGKSFAVGFDGQ